MGHSVDPLSCVFELIRKPIPMASYMIRKAKPEDCVDIVGFIKELAEYQCMLDQVDMTPAKLEADAFCTEPFVNLLVAVCSKSNQTVGYSSFSYTYGSWKGRTVYMDDLYVSPQHRGAGLGTSLMQAVAKSAVERGCNRMNWIVLSWNTRPKELYARLGADNLSEKEGWQSISLFQDNLELFADKLGANPKILFDL
uniref:thialysine N-epsilon-acetyltransferase-like isoform X2 n=1 Tax=Myxine glutinosa TaxID=7769 RepID=UPI00358E38C2